MKKVIELQIKICPTCGESKPLDPKYWRRDKSTPDGFNRHCKLCIQKSIKAHYRPYSNGDVAERGKVGVRCLLWSPKCGVCPCIGESDLSACWRIAKIEPDSESYPVELI